MPSSLKRHAPLVGLTVVFAFLALLHSLKSTHAHSDPDRYFHLAIARLTLENGIVKDLPQIEDMGWKYADKNFLFTVLTVGFFRLGGEKAVDWIPLLLGLSLFGLLFWHGSRHLKDPFAALTPILLLVLIVPFFERSVLLRPHTLAVLWFTGLAVCLLQGRPWGAAAMGALFALSYHAVYLPAALIGLTLFFSSSLGPRHLKTVLLGLGGLALGLVLHPDFPLNARDAWTTLRIALGAAGVPGGQRPIEEAGFGGFVPFLQAYGGLFIVGTFGALRLFPSTSRAQPRLKGQPRCELIFLLAASAGLLLLTCLSRRAVEYSAPLFALVLIHWTASLKHRPAYLGALAGGMLLFHLPVAASFYRTGLSPGVRDLPNQTLEALRALPPEADGKKLFNCEWDLTPMVLYARPRLRFVDILGPSALLETSPAKYWLRRRMNEGAVPHPFGVVKHLFGAEYALCDNPRLIRQWDRDPHFVRLHPSGDYQVGQMALFLVAPDLRSEMILDYEVEGGDSQWRPLEFLRAPPRNQRSPSLDLGRWSAETGIPTATCFSLRPAAAELASHEGADTLGVGGGPDVSLTWNGMKYDAPYPQKDEPPRLVSALFKLPRPIRKTDRIVARVCGADPMLSLSLWKKETVRALCARKGSPLPESRGTAAIGVPTCLGLMVDP